MNSGQFKKGEPSWNKGTHLSGMLGKHHRLESKSKIGEANKKDNPKTNLNILIRKSPQFKEWRLSVFDKDNYVCQECGADQKLNRNLRLHPHHIKAFAVYPALRFKVDNGKTLCESCHGKVHDIDFNGFHRKYTCPICGKIFEPQNGQYSRKTCSKECGYEYRKLHGNTKKGKHYPHLQRARIGNCLVCGKEYRATADFKTRKQKYCSHACYLKARWGL